MNWLAHAFLSEPDAEFQLGNLLADLIKGPDRRNLSAAFNRGLACHQVIDGFTDAHPVVRRSRCRIAPPLRRFAGIIVDVYYDHVLARDWMSYSKEPLGVFTARLYAAIQSRAPALPREVLMAAAGMIAADRLGSYRHIEGVEAALRRISARLSARTGRPVALDDAMENLRAQDTDLTADFTEFFPDLQARVKTWAAAPGAAPERSGGD